MKRVLLAALVLVSMGLCACDVKQEDEHVFAELKNGYPYKVEYQSAGKKDKAPNASQIVADLFEAVNKYDQTVTLELLGFDPKMYTAEEFEGLLDTIMISVDAGRETETQVTLREFAKLDKTYTSTSQIDNTFNTSAVTIKVKLADKNRLCKVEVIADDEFNLVAIKPDSSSKLSTVDAIVKLPGKGLIGGTDYAGSLTTNKETCRYVEDDFYVYSISNAVIGQPLSVSTTTAFGVFEGTTFIDGESSILGGQLHTFNPVIPVEQVQTYVPAINKLLSDVLVAFNAGDVETVKTLFTDAELAERQLQAVTDRRKERNITAVEVLLDETRTGENIVLSETRCKVMLKYLVKFDIKWNIETTKATCKDYMYLELELKDGVWKIDGLEEQAGIFTLLKESHNEW